MKYMANKQSQLKWMVLLLLALGACGVNDRGTDNILRLSDEGKVAKTVYLTHDEKGIPVAAWTEADSAGGASRLYFARWDALKKAFGNKLSIPASPSIVAHAEGMPKIAFTEEGKLYAVYAARISGRNNPYAGRIEYLISGDGGQSWSGPAIVHRDSSQEAGHDFFDVVALPGERIGVSWLDKSHQKGGRPVHFALTDSTGRFTYETVVDDYACECCRTALYVADGKIALLYRDIKDTPTGTVRDIHYSLSMDGGKSFKNGWVYSKDEWRVDGCPHNGPDIVVDGESLFATWFTAGKNKGLYYGELDISSGQLDRTLLDADGRFAQLALLPDGRRAVVYNAQREAGGRVRWSVFAQTFPNGEVISISPPDKSTGAPVVIGLKDSSVIVAWISQNEPFAQVQYKVMDFDMLLGKETNALF
ncbi:sialidase family protein [Parapedobacter tibetensis]|uniref:sialidase family protein n=1 Tax=Parapedobacter tibetensis TaxID=2972951 RepID=UPI00214D6122|nr:sialidase family protein [Parapedobacter tibetensis]